MDDAYCSCGRKTTRELMTVFRSGVYGTELVCEFVGDVGHRFRSGLRRVLFLAAHPRNALRDWLVTVGR